MKSIIIGTAGHIDHGKTALVKALTGIDADRLEEEKRRGITIDLGFAHLELPSPEGERLRLGLVDVPGHERFVRNMLAGVGGMDLVLFVIAADESIKPQTREHFDICRLLAVGRGITVLTKSDLVDQETLEVVRLEVEEFLRGSFLDRGRSPLVAVSARTGEGMEELKREMARIAAEAQSRDSAAHFRLPIDRVFTMKGFGTVITGTLIAGSVSKEDEVEVFPARKRARVRGVQVHNLDSAEARAGQRTALNLTGIGNDELARGMTLAAPGVLEPTQSIDARLTLLPGARPLRDRGRVHLHAYTSETVAQCVLSGAQELVPGGEAFAQLRLSKPLLLLPGDRFIIRQFSPVVTVGGGVVLDAAPRASRAAAAEFLQVFASGEPAQILEARIARRGSAGLTRTQAIAETGWRGDEVERWSRELIATGKVLQAGESFLHSAELEPLERSLLARVADFHTHNPLADGLSKEELRDKAQLSPEAHSLLLARLAGAGKLEITGEKIRAAGRKVVLKDDEAESKAVIEQAFARAGLKVPALKEVLDGLKLDRSRAQKLVTLLLRDKVLVKLSDELVFHREALATLRAEIAAYKATAPKLDVARFKDLTGVSRKYAIPLLEYLDREHVTRRVGDERLIL